MLAKVTDVLIARFFDGLVGKHDARVDWRGRLKTWVGRIRGREGAP
jgi:hypothetical protein